MLVFAFVQPALSLTATTPTAPLASSIYSLKGPPSAANLDLAKAAGIVTLWDTHAPRARPVAQWELKLFFQAENDMQQQLGLRAQRDADKTFGSISVVMAAGVVVSNAFISNDNPVLSSLGYLAAMLPFLVLAAGVVLPDVVQRILVTVWRWDPVYRRRQTYHEAGHFLCGYLCGLSVEGYDTATGEGASSAVRFAPSATLGDDHAAVDRLAVVSMAGVAAEVLVCGDAEGGIADVNSLRALMSRASPPISGRTQQDDRIRWGCLMALTLLQQRRSALDALAEAFDASASVGECLLALESAEREGGGADSFT